MLCPAHPPQAQHSLKMQLILLCQAPLSRLRTWNTDTSLPGDQLSQPRADHQLSTTIPIFNQVPQNWVNDRNLLDLSFQEASVQLFLYADKSKIHFLHPPKESPCPEPVQEQDVPRLQKPESVQSQPLARAVPARARHTFHAVSCRSWLGSSSARPVAQVGFSSCPREHSKGHPDPCARPGCLSPAPQTQQARPHHFLWHPPKGTAVRAAPREEPGLIPLKSR